jgi:transposase
MAEQEHRRRRRRQFTPEFKRDAVELVRATGRPIAHIAAELGIYDSTLGRGSSRPRSTAASVRA